MVVINVHAMGPSPQQHLPAPFITGQMCDIIKEFPSQSELWHLAIVGHNIQEYLSHKLWGISNVFKSIFINSPTIIISDDKYRTTLVGNTWRHICVPPPWMSQCILLLVLPMWEVLYKYFLQAKCIDDMPSIPRLCQFSCGKGVVSVVQIPTRQHDRLTGGDTRPFQRRPKVASQVTQKRLLIG